MKLFKVSILFAQVLCVGLILLASMYMYTQHFEIFSFDVQDKNVYDINLKNYRNLDFTLSELRVKKSHELLSFSSKSKQILYFRFDTTSTFETISHTYKLMDDLLFLKNHVWSRELYKVTLFVDTIAILEHNNDIIDLIHFLFQEYIEIPDEQIVMKILPQEGFFDTSISDFVVLNHTSELRLFEKCVKFINTRKYISECMPKPKNSYPILITGLGGSGTHYVSRILREMGFNVQHEALGSHGSVAWQFAVNEKLVSSGKYPYISDKITSENTIWSPRFRYIIHLVRDSLSQISSLSSHSDKTFEFLVQFFKHDFSREATVSKLNQFKDIIKVDKKCYRDAHCNLERAAILLLFWNQHIAQSANFIVSVENKIHLFFKICQLSEELYMPTNICKEFLSSNLTNQLSIIVKLESFINDIERHKFESRSFFQKYWFKDKFEDDKWLHSKYNHPNFSISDLKQVNMALANIVIGYDSIIN